MINFKSRLAIRVSNLCRPHVNVERLNDVRKSDNQASECVHYVHNMYLKWDKPSIVAFTVAAGLSANDIHKDSTAPVVYTTTSTVQCG